MKSFLTKLPVSFGCVALGFISLGALSGSTRLFFLVLFGGISVLFQLAVIAKLLLPVERKKIPDDSISFSSLAGTTMAAMLTAAQIKKHTLLPGAEALWIAAVVCHLLIMIFFSRRYLFSRSSLDEVRGSWLLVYVGIAAAAISAPAFSEEKIGTVSLVLAAIGAFYILPLVYRTDLLLEKVPQKQKPLFCISAAPVSIWLSGYLASGAPCLKPLVMFLLLASQLLYIPALIRCVKTIRDPFTPAFAAFTFPFVITASSLKQASAFVGLADEMSILVGAETAVAVFLCVLTAARFLRAGLSEGVSGLSGGRFW